MSSTEALTPSNHSKDHGPLPVDLIALSSLTPPSPILSPVGLDASWSWSDIPIEFELERENEGSEQLLSPPNADLSDYATVKSIILSSASTTTIGTFGPTQKRHANRHSGSWSPVSQHFEDTLIPKVSTDAIFDTSSSSSWQSALHSPSKKYCCQTADGLDGVADNAGPYSPLYSVRSLKKAQAKSIQTPASVFTLSLKQNGPCQTTSELDTTRGSDVLPANSNSRQQTSTIALASLENRCLSAPSSPQSFRIPVTLLASEPPYGLPKHLEWLERTTVELLIDQEGFRAVLARFKYMKNLRPESRFGNSEFGLVQFRPVHRQAFLFHYAPLDALPVLRRVTINGEESQDYISRQASLGLKVNGAYFVSGNEPLSFPVPNYSGRIENLELQWRFEYAVDDKGVVRSNKKSIGGEKILTPLAFSCSPHLLHPLQGKRVRLMHVVKKSVTTKLNAQRMKLPGLHTPAIYSQLKDGQSVMQPTFTRFQEEKKRGWDLRKGAATQWTIENYVDEIADREPARPLSPAIVPVDQICSMRPPRRRRASSAGELSCPRSKASTPFIGSSSSADAPFRNNIIPPSHLISLMKVENDQSNEIQPTPTVPTSSTDTHFFTALSPSPRRYQTGIA